MATVNGQINMNLTSASGLMSVASGQSDAGLMEFNGVTTTAMKAIQATATAGLMRVKINEP